MGFRFRKSFKIAPGLRLNLGKRGASWSIGRPGATVNIGKRGVRTTLGIPGTGLSKTFGEGGAAQVKPGGCLQLVVGGVLILLLFAGLRSCITGGSPPQSQDPISTPAVGSAGARLAEIERKKAEEQQWADHVAQINEQFRPVLGEIKAAGKASLVEGGWDDVTKRMALRAVLPGGDAHAFLALACNRLAEGGFSLVEGAWTRVQVEIPPAKKSKPGEKWGSVADSVNTIRAWKGCAGTAGVTPEFWRTVAAMPGFVDLYGGRPQLDADVVQLVVNTGTEEEKLRFVVGVCQAAKTYGLRVKHVRTHLAPEFPDKVHWRGTLHKC